MRMETMARSQNTSHWWNEILFQEETSIVVTLPGHTECLGSCLQLERQVHRSPPRLLTERYFGAALFVSPGLLTIQ
jgi:hypothetical protein